MVFTIRKAKMYQIVLDRASRTDWCVMPSMKHTDYHKDFGKPKYYLEWPMGDRKCVACMTCYNGRFSMTITLLEGTDIVKIEGFPIKDAEAQRRGFYHE